MAKREEAKFSQILRLLIMGAGGHFSRVEAHASADGIPDVDYCLDGTEGHLELKVGHSTKDPELRGSQFRWFKNRADAGGKPMVLLQDSDTGDVMVYFFRHLHGLKGRKTMIKWREKAFLTFTAEEFDSEEFLIFLTSFEDIPQ